MRIRSFRGPAAVAPPESPSMTPASSASAAALHLIVALAAVALAFPGAAANARQEAQEQQQQQPPPPTAAQPAPSRAQQPGPAGRQFLEAAARGNAAEVAAGRLALEKGRDEEVRRLARMLVDEHGRAQTRLAALAKESGIDLPDAPDPLHQELAARLREASADEFDRQFVAGQVRDHLMAISLYEHAAGLARDPAVSAFARDALPDLRRHGEEVFRLAQRLRVSVAGLEVAARAASGAAVGSTPFQGVDAPRTGPGATPPGTPPGATPPGAITPGAAATGGIPLDALRAAPAGYLNRQMTGTVRVGERLGDRVFYVVPTTGAAAAGTGAGTTATDNRGVLAVLDESFTDANTPRLVAGQIVEIAGVVRSPGATGAGVAVPMGELSQNLRERVRREPVVLLLRRLTLRPAGAGTAEPGRPGT